MSFRTEEKIVVTHSEMFQLQERLRTNGMTRLYPSRQIISVYFDSTGSRMFEDSEEGVLPRKKIRIRHYAGSEYDQSLEIKISSIEGRFKTTRSLSSPEYERALRRGIFDSRYGQCAPRAVVSYNRSYYSLDGVRVTFDTDIFYNKYGSAHKIRDPLKVVEIKAPKDAPRDFLERVITEPRRRFSKFSRANLLTYGI